jgi:hypothetical protein
MRLTEIQAICQEMQQLPMGAYVIPGELVLDREQKSKNQVEKIQIVYMISIFI